MSPLPEIEAAALRLMALKRFVLLIGDAGAALVRLSGTSVEEHSYFSAPIADNIAQARRALSVSPKVPVVVVYDVLGQSYRRDRLPPANLLDRPKIMARKLDTLFPGTALKGGLLLGPAEGEVRGYDYLFAAITALPEMVQWQKMLDQIENPVSDARLLPVESASLLQRLAARASQGENKPSQWNILISQHRTGGFRQIVTRANRLSIARMTSGFIEIEAAAETGALLRREIGATIDYITRLGFDRAEGLNAIFIGRHDIGDALLQMQLPVRRLTVFSPQEAEQIAGISGAADASGHFADLLHAAWGGSRLAPALSIWPAEKRAQRMQSLAGQWATRALAAGSIAGLIYAAVLGWNIRSAISGYERAEAERGALQQAYDAEVSKLDSGPVPITVMRDFLAIHDQLLASQTDLTPFFATLDASLSGNAPLRAIRVNFDDPPQIILPEQVAEGLPAPSPVPAPITGRVWLVLDLSSFQDAELAVAETDRLVNALRTALPDMRITITRQPLQILPADTFTVKPGENVLAFSGNEQVAEIELHGRLR